jgi:hypothetical protein
VALKKTLNIPHKHREESVVTEFEIFSSEVFFDHNRARHIWFVSNRSASSPPESAASTLRALLSFPSLEQKII